ncbi:hypothetical protein HHI36_013007 [Cryptolaemus montrouzieri]|uniref:ZAD domain-containing protein n=1 Tax=Cryptolaemus montrouzieri TaxID=559131 RepID=A0ABD2NH83_9CUCU
MYYLANFCRICIKTDVDLVDVDSDDVDSIKLQKKLEECTEMVINRESLSTKICTLCIKKLRISYEFHNMCKRSTSLLQGLLTELMKNNNCIDDEEQMFDIYPEEIKKEIPFEEVVVEPDIRVKTELLRMKKN